MIVRWNEVTAVFGGTFDPPHLGHREAIRGLFSAPRIRRVIVVPAGTPPQKTSFSSTEHRLTMVKMNFAPTVTDLSFPRDVEISLLEIQQASSEPNYTYKTLEKLRQQWPHLALTVGADQLANLSTWYRFPEILGLCHWIVLERKPDGGPTVRRTLQEWEAQGLIERDYRSSGEWESWQIRGTSAQSTSLIVVPTQAPAISGTQIRETIGRTGLPPEGALLSEVAQHLKRNHLYGSKESDGI